MAHIDLESYFKLNFALIQHHKYSLTEIDNMMPWERDIYVGLLNQWIEDENLKVESFLVDHHPVKEALGFRFFFGDKKIIISGDTEITDNVFSLVNGADFLIHDGMIKDHVRLLEKVAKENNVYRAEVAFHDILDYHADVIDIKRNLENKDLGLLIINHLVPAKNPIGIRYMEDLFSDVSYDFLLARDNDKIIVSKNSDEIIIN